MPGSGETSSMCWKMISPGGAQPGPGTGHALRRSTTTDLLCQPCCTIPAPPLCSPFHRSFLFISFLVHEKDTEREGESGVKGRWPDTHPTLTLKTITNMKSALSLSFLSFFLSLQQRSPIGLEHIRVVKNKEEQRVS